MTPHRNTRKTKAGKRVASGSYVVDRVFKHIGRVHLASGIRNASTFRAFNDGLSEMAKESAGREWIRAMNRRQVAPIDVWGAFRTGRWRKAPTPETAELLVDAITDWREDTKREVSKDTYRVRKECVAKVKEFARSGATVEELPAVLRAIRTGMKHAPAQFNTLRNYYRAFVRDTLGTRHDIYLAIKHDIGAIKILGHAKKKERKRHPLTPAEVRLLASKFSTTHPGGSEGAPGHGYTVIAMALTGMNPKEYFLDGFTETLTYVKVHGEKRGGRERLVPKLYPSTLWLHPVLKRPGITKHSFERAFAKARKAAKLTCTPLDLRRSFANWMEQCGVERTLRRQIRGHGPKDVGDLYETRQLQQHMVDVAQLMIPWIDRQLEQRPQLVEDVR